MDCCAHYQGLNRLFDERTARGEVDRYLKQGSDKHARAFTRAIGVHHVADASLLEIGGGIGDLHLDLLQRGAARAISVDISAAYLSASQALSERLGLRERVQYHRADFAREAETIPAADVVLLHRVVCCYPDMPTLVKAAADHTGRLLALSFPRDAWYMRLARLLFNLAMWISRSGFRFYLHAPADITHTASEAGLRLRDQSSSWPWQIMVFERAAPA